MPTTYSFWSPEGDSPTICGECPGRQLGTREEKLMIEKPLLDRHLQYTAWATDRLLTAVGGIPVDQLTHDFKTGDRTIINTLAHIFAADRVWLHRVNGRRPAVFIEDRDRE